MANMFKNLDLFSEENDRQYWKSKASVETVKKPRNPQEDTDDFNKAITKDIPKDVLPKDAIAEKDKKKNDMKMTPTEAFIECYPYGQPNAFSPNTKPSIPTNASLQLDLPKNGCNDSIGLNVGSLIEQTLKQNMNAVIDMTASIASTKEQVLYKPFKTPSGPMPYAVYARDANDKIVRVDFDVCKASDSTDLGPKWESKYWGAKIDAKLCATAKEESIDDWWNFYFEKVKNPKASSDWDGKTWYRQADLLKKMPELVNAQPAYRDLTPINKTPNVGASAPTNPNRTADQAKAF